MKVSWRVTASDAFTEWVNSGKSGVEAVQWLMDYLSKHVQVVHERGEPILVDGSIMDNAAIYYNQDEIRFDNIPDSIRMTRNEAPYAEFPDDATT